MFAGHFHQGPAEVRTILIVLRAPSPQCAETSARLVRTGESTRTRSRDEEWPWLLSMRFWKGNERKAAFEQAFALNKYHGSPSYLEDAATCPFEAGDTKHYLNSTIHHATTRCCRVPVHFNLVVWKWFQDSSLKGAALNQTGKFKGSGGLCVRPFETRFRPLAMLSTRHRLKAGLARGIMRSRKKKKTFTLSRKALCSRKRTRKKTSPFCFVSVHLCLRLAPNQGFP